MSQKERVPGDANQVRGVHCTVAKLAESPQWSFCCPHKPVGTQHPVQNRQNEQQRGKVRPLSLGGEGARAPAQVPGVSVDAGIGHIGASAAPDLQWPQGDAPELPGPREHPGFSRSTRQVDAPRVKTHREGGG